MVMTFLRGNNLYVGWLGDSQALLVRGGLPLQLVEPHKPEREVSARIYTCKATAFRVGNFCLQDEQRRIEEAGGMVIWMGAWRVNGNLSVSRAIGDAKDKAFVIGEADVSSFELDGSEDYLVVACDGLWDVLNGEEVVECVKSHLAKPQAKRHTVAESLVNLAKSEGSGDNITAIVVYFKGFTDRLSSEQQAATDPAACDKSCDKSETGTNG